MSEDEAQPFDEPAPDAAQGEQAQAAEIPADDLAAQLEAAQAQAEQHRDQHMRALAELENVRKRAEREVTAARKFALEKFASELLGVRDSLEMGLQAAGENAGDFDSLREGVEMTARMLASAMEKFGVEVSDPVGEPFDPEYHEAVTMQATDQQPPNTVVTVMQKGYLLNGRVLRPAMVVVSKAPEQA